MLSCRKCCLTKCLSCHQLPTADERHGGGSLRSILTPVSEWMRDWRNEGADKMLGHWSSTPFIMSLLVYLSNTRLQFPLSQNRPHCSNGHRQHACEKFTKNWEKNCFWLTHQRNNLRYVLLLCFITTQHHASPSSAHTLFYPSSPTWVVRPFWEKPVVFYTTHQPQAGI